MAQIKFFQDLIKSFYSPAFYQEVAHSWRGLGLRYLFFVVTLASLPYLIGYVFDVHARLADFQEVFQEHPEIKIEKDHLVIPDRTQIVKVYSKSDPQKLLAVIDPAFFADPETKRQANIVMQDDQFLVRGRTGNHIFSYHTVNNHLTLSGEWLNANKYFLLIFLPLMIWVISLFSLYLYRILQSLFYSLVSLIIYKRKKWHAYLEGHDVIRLCAVALTPCILITGLGDFINLFWSNIFMPYTNYLLVGYIILNLTYVGLAFYWNRQSAPEASPTNSPKQG